MLLGELMIMLILIEVSSPFLAFPRSRSHADVEPYLTEFALNCGLPFFTPEEYFLEKPASKNWRLSGFNAKLFDHSRQFRSLHCALKSTAQALRYPAVPLYSPTSTPLLPRRSSEFEEQGLEVVIFVGSPGAGKSTFYKKHFAPRGYVHIVSPSLGSLSREGEQV